MMSSWYACVCVTIHPCTKDNLCGMCSSKGNFTVSSYAHTSIQVCVCDVHYIYACFVMYVLIHCVFSNFIKSRCQH